MKIINSKEEYEEFYYYKTAPPKYPSSYPCLVRRKCIDGGLAGDYTIHSFKEIPKGINPKQFQEILEMQWVDLD